MFSQVGLPGQIVSRPKLDPKEVSYKGYLKLKIGNLAKICCLMLI